jgi:hypothetical protein
MNMKNLSYPEGCAGSHEPSFNHAYSIGFSLISNHPEGDDVTPEMLRTALLKRISELDETINTGPWASPEGEWIEAVGCPFDTYEEKTA